MLPNQASALPGTPTGAASAHVPHRIPPEIWFVGGILFSCLFLQRFGTSFGGRVLNITGPIGLGLALLGLVNGTLAFHRRRTIIFGLLLICSFIAEAHALSRPPPLGGVFSLPSFYQWVAITSFAVFTFARPMEEQRFFRLVNRFMVVIAGFGIAQFFAQFAGISIFSFKGLLPDAILAEGIWHLQIDSGIGALYKSNSFWLVEPSVTSQFMAVGLAIEFLFFRRPLYFALLGLNLVLAFSGTGGIVLVCFLISLVFTMGRRGIGLAVLAVLILGAMGTALFAAAPDAAQTLLSRMGEVNEIGTSGFDRFITPFWLLSDVLRAVPEAWLVGIGSGVSEHLTLAYDYTTNTPIKTAVEYGFPAMLLYCVLFLVHARTRRQGTLTFPCFVLLVFTGAYQQFGPVVYLVTLITCTARLYETADAPADLVPARPQRPRQLPER